MSILATILLYAILSPVLAQYPPPSSASTDPSILTVRSPVDGNITISYKSPPIGTCTTVFTSQQQYTGYVTLPPFTLAPVQQNYTINTFFWFIEARTSPQTAPLTIYLNGGPGSSSMVGLFQESGPCEVVEIAQGQLGTQAREWGWDRSSNLLFIDQPNQVGFSYDSLTNASLNLLTSELNMPPIAAPTSQPSYSFINGTFSSGNTSSTPNTTEIAAQAIWHMLQGFLGTFPQYDPGKQSNSTTNDGTTGINLFVESYGGKYGPAFASFFQSQNARRQQGTLAANSTLNIDLVSLGIINGCVDDLIQGPFYPLFAYNNTYGIQAISLVDQQTAANAFQAANGCQQLIEACRDEIAAYDPSNDGDMDAVNTKCSQAEYACTNSVMDPYASSGRSFYDITQSNLDPFPQDTFLEYLNTAAVQSAIGAPINFTMTSDTVVNAFTSTGDYERGNYINDLAYLLSQGIRVALIYGDRDYACNWLGGEAVSFSIAGAAQPAYSSWYSAGYAPIIVNSSYIGGEVREVGNLSFSRIYDAGHLVPAYQPETAFTVFTRVIEGTQISSGEPMSLISFASSGDPNSTYINSAPAMASPTCYLRAVESTCASSQKAALANGQGVTINGVWYSSSAAWSTPASSVSMAAGMPGTPASSVITSPTTSGSNGGSASGTKTTTTTTGGSGGGGQMSSSLPTGVYVATATPSTSTKGTASKQSGSFVTTYWALGVFMILLGTVI